MSKMYYLKIFVIKLCVIYPLFRIHNTCLTSAYFGLDNRDDTKFFLFEIRNELFKQSPFSQKG
jgi:hypothetical protein